MSEMETKTSRNITPEAIENETTEVKQQALSKFDAKNYLNVKLENGETEKKIRIRLLTVDKDSNSPFLHIHMHNVKVGKEIAKSGWKSYVCLNKTHGEFTEKLGTKCPFCEMRNMAYQKSLEATDEIEKKRWQDISIANIPNEVVVIRCIERGHEEDGPKFWKFNVRKDKKDPYNMILELYKMRKKESIEDGDEVPENILDIDNGKDLEVTITQVDNKKTSISIIDCGKNKPLTKDVEQRDAWLNDEKIWSDVFVAKPYEYCSVILEGEVPFYDKKEQKWVAKSETEYQKADDDNMADEKIKEAEAEVVNNVTSSQKDESIEVVSAEELPF